jgi:inosose dehydratase
VAEEVAAVASHLDLLAAMGCNVMVFAEGHGSTDGDPSAPLSRRPVLSDDGWPGFCAKLDAVARHLRERGVRLAFHHHMGTVVQTEAEIDR